MYIWIEGGRKRRGRGSGDGEGEGEGGEADGEGDSDGSEGDQSADDDRPRKRGRPPASHREKIKGFTDQEVSSIIRSIFIYLFNLMQSVTNTGVVWVRSLPSENGPVWWDGTLFSFKYALMYQLLEIFNLYFNE